MRVSYEAAALKAKVAVAAFGSQNQSAGSRALPSHSILLVNAHSGVHLLQSGFAPLTGAWTPRLSGGKVHFHSAGAEV